MFIFQRSRNPLFSWGLGLLTLAVLLTNIPPIDAIDQSLWLFFVALVGLMLNAGMIINDGVISPAPTAALMAYLTLDHAPSAALWSIAVGCVAGYAVWTLRQTFATDDTRRLFVRLLRDAVISSSQLVLGLVVGGWVYQQSGGRIPLAQMTKSDILPLAISVFVYLIVYVSILLAEFYLYRRRSPRVLIQQAQVIAGIIVLPIPFAILGAIAYRELSSLSFSMLIFGLLVLVAGLHLISQAQARYQQQVLELSALSTISQAMRTSLDMHALLDVVYHQVKTLLNISSFTVALMDANRNMLYFPTHIQNRRPVPLEPRTAGHGLFEYVIQQKNALLLPDKVAERARDMGLTPPDSMVQSWLGVPLQAPDRTIGCMAVSSTRPYQHFTPNDLHLLMTIAGQAGIAIDNAQLYGQARDRSQQLATLNNISTILSGTLDVEQILDLAGSSAVAVTNCDAVALYMWWEGTQHPLTLARHTGLSEDYVTNPPRLLVLNIDDLHRRRQPVIVTDCHIDQRTRDLRAVMDREQKRAWIEFLLRKGDELLGVLVFFYHEPRAFSAEEVELLRTFTNQAALAISNARLYTRTDEALNRRVEQLSALADINRELTSTLHLQGVFELVLNRALEATQSRIGALLLRVDTDVPTVVAQQGFEARVVAHNTLLAGFIAQCYETGEPTLIADISQEQDYRFPDSQTRAQLNVPILRGVDVLGVISLGSDRPNDYSSDDLAFVTQLATQARIAIDNAQMFRRIEIARDRLQVILDSMKEGVILLSAEGVITLANPRVERLLGLDPNRIIDVPLLELAADQDLALAERFGFPGKETLLEIIKLLSEGRWDDSSRDEGKISYQIQMPKLHFIDRTDAPVRDETGQIIGLLMVFADVTEEHELAQAREDISSMIVHDLRGPLTAVTTSLKLLGEIAASDDPVGKMIKNTTDLSSRAVRKLLSLVDSLLDVSKMESGLASLECEPTRIAAVCSNVIDELAPLAQEMEVELHLLMPDDLPLLNADSNKLERVLLNLVDNAIKFTPSRGEVVIQAHAASEGFIRLDVQDTGPGIPDDYKERLFDRYAQIDGQRGRRRGTGLGLTFCKMTVEAHGGRIWVEDNPNGGAIFSFIMPVLKTNDYELTETGEE